MGYIDSDKEYLKSQDYNVEDLDDTKWRWFVVNLLIII